MGRRHLNQLLPLAPIALAACGAPEVDLPVTVTREIVSGVEVVTSSVRGAAPTLPWLIDTARAVVIGSIDGPAESRFGRLAAVTRAPDGRIFAADGDARVIRVFGPRGDYLRSIGRDGEGPGEFRSIDGVAFDAAAHRLLARDPLLNRVSVFDSTGEFKISFLLSRPFAQFSRRTSLWTDSEGRLYDFTHIGSTFSLDSLGVVRYRPSGDVIDTTLVAAVTPRRLLLRGADGQPREGAQVPFAAFPRAAVSTSGLVIGGTGEEYELQVFDGGTLIRRIRKTDRARAVPGWAGDTVDAVVRRMREREPNGIVDRDELPKTQPFYNSVLVDSQGFAWVGREGLDQTPAGRYDVFDSSGAFIGVIETIPLLLDEVGDDYVAGRTVDAYEVERVVVMDLTRH